MGIRFLNSFIDKIDGLRKTIQLNDTNLVIDGNNVLHLLLDHYIESHPGERVYGGNYVNFEKFFQTFFKSLKKAKITAFVVFDGGINLDLIENRKQRFEDRFSRCRGIADGYSTCDDHIFPPLLREVFNDVINQFKVQSFQTWKDADLETARLANHLKCPVLSDDSDFLIMDIEFGVISFRDFNWSTPSAVDSSIECKKYNVRDFVKVFNGLKLEMLPIFATLLGNDFLNNEDIFISLFKEIGFTPDYHVVNDVQTYNTYDNKTDLMNRILIWLSKKFANAVHAIHFIQQYFHEKHLKTSQTLETVFKRSVKSYDVKLKKSYLNQLIGLQSSTTVNQLTTDLVVFRRKPLIPKEFVLEYHLNQSSKILVNFVEEKFHFFYPTVEDFSLNSVHQSSQPLLSIICSIMRLNRNETNSVVVMTRIGTEIKEITITSEDYDIKQVMSEDLPLFGEIHGISAEKRLQFVLKILGSIEMMSEMRQTLSLLSIKGSEMDFWIYFIVVVKYWLRNSSTTIPFPMVYALIVSVIHNKYRDRESRDVRQLFNKMSETIVENENKSFDIRLVHYYSEFQIVLKLIDSLNSLFCKPLDSNLSLLFVSLNSILINNLCHQVMNHGFHLFSSQRLDSFFWIIYNLIK